MLGIGDEMSIFLQAMLAGNIVILVYTCIRIFRRLIRHSLFFISLEDFFFWIWVGAYLFKKIYNTSDGSIRWFFYHRCCDWRDFHFFCTACSV